MTGALPIALVRFVLRTSRLRVIRAQRPAQVFRRRPKRGASFSVFALRFQRAPEGQICSPQVAGRGDRLIPLFQDAQRSRGVGLRIVHSPELKLDPGPAYQNRRKPVSAADPDGFFQDRHRLIGEAQRGRQIPCRLGIERLLPGKYGEQTVARRKTAVEVRRRF